jgi:hypothetical protein
MHASTGHGRGVAIRIHKVCAGGTVQGQGHTTIGVTGLFRRGFCALSVSLLHDCVRPGAHRIRGHQGALCYAARLASRAPPVATMVAEADDA